MKKTNFLYTAINIRGEEVSGQMAALSENEVMNVLENQNLLIVEIKKQGHLQEFLTKQRSLHVGKIGLSELAQFAKDLGIILQSGIVILEALAILKNRSRNPVLKKDLENVQLALRKGETLSGALGNLSFPPLFIFLVKTGENSGELPRMLTVIGDYYENAYHNRQKMKEILAYPLLLIAVSLVVSFFLLTVVLPQFTGIFQSMDQELPPLTIWFINISDWLRGHIYWVFASLATILLFYFLTQNTPAARIWLDRIKNQLPIYGKMRQWEFLMLFSKVLGILTNSGLDLINALRGLKEITKNREYQMAISKLIEEVKQGSSMTEAMADLPVFEETFGQFMAVGESSGLVGEMMAMTSSFYESQYKHRIGMLQIMLEPLLLLIIGGGVLLMMLAIMMPVFDLYLIYSNL
ncbi:type II secretion system F family protein [Eubacteriaceae bacterium ES2]|nr:type II secretion system F family protein [Eubacteriaceae bacterium ES2]